MSKASPFSLDDMAVFEQDAKIALLATVSPTGLPHLSLITSIQAKDSIHLMFGQFSEGRSKAHLKRNPEAGFLIMSRDKRMWRGKARYTGEAKSGEDYEMYNRKPMFRYNSYFGIHTVHYLDLIEFNGAERLRTAAIAAGTAATVLGRRLAAETNREDILKPFAQELFTKLRTLKFLCYVAGDGYPVVIPVVPCQAAGSTRLMIAQAGHGGELAQLASGTPIAVLALNLEMESVLARGRLGKRLRLPGLTAGVIDIDWVYNSMPPMQGQIYPVERLAPSATKSA
jgi:hypothetical protein